jgi:BirA family biotin operon repressor/biotin-[acetyl-CoA-carboxylase] ligase
MDQRTLEQLLADLPLGPLRYYDRIASTNDDACRWASRGAQDLSLVVADEQTAGRGRINRRWFTPPGAALAFSLILQSRQQEHTPASWLIPRFTALGALAVCDALQEEYKVAAQIKWPNDVLVGGGKVAGVLVETQWLGDQLQAAIVGIGVNVSPVSVPPVEAVSFPSACVQNFVDQIRRENDDLETSQRVDRWELLRSLLSRLLEWREVLFQDVFISAWEERLAYIGEWVRVTDIQSPTTKQMGQVIGLERDGSLKLRTDRGDVIHLYSGDVNLRPLK